MADEERVKLVHDLLEPYYPVFDAVPVVRCRDCCYFSAETIPSCTSVYGMIDPEPDDFCSYGERRNDDAAD